MYYEEHGSVVNIVLGFLLRHGSSGVMPEAYWSESMRETQNAAAPKIAWNERAAIPSDEHRADLVWAGLSLPFCPPTHFDRHWAEIVTSVGAGGRFAGDYFQ